jgi:hypothetical protein
MKKIILLAIIAIYASSCASLYTTPAAPTVFLEQRDGIAIQTGIGTNLATNFASVSATKAVTSEVCLNASGSYGFMGNYFVDQNPYKSSKKLGAYAINAGWNTRKVTIYPMQLWIGINGGSSSDSYSLAYWEKNTSKDVTINPLDSFYRLEKLSGSYFSTRIALNHVIISNYENDIKIRERKKVKFDIIGTASYNNIRYNYANGDSIKSARNSILGYATSIRVYKKNWILGLHLDNIVSAKGLFDELLNKNLKSAEFTQIPFSIPSISYTFFIGQHRKR